MRRMLESELFFPQMGGFFNDGVDDNIQFFGGQVDVTDDLAVERVFEISLIEKVNQA
jgi:hypothetical protein